MKKDKMGITGYKFQQFPQLFTNQTVPLGKERPLFQRNISENFNFTAYA